MAFQSFTSTLTPPELIAERVAALRALFDDLAVDAIIIPHEDAYQSEYVPASEDRLGFICGFTGSAGRAIITRDTALFATDGRYTLQAAAEVPGDTFTIVSTASAAEDWRKAHLAGLRVGADLSLHSRADAKRMADAAKDISIVPLATHPVDDIWPDRPALPTPPVRAHPLEFAGWDTAEKIAALREDLAADAVFISAADAASWLLNWRGSTVAHTPIALARVFLPKAGKATVFVDPATVPADLANALDPIADMVSPSDLIETLERLSEGLTVQADPAQASEAALLAIERGGALKEAADPATALKACKVPAEIAGMRAAHERDAVAMVRFLTWFDENAAGSTEIQLAETLEGFRRQASSIDISFDTISGSGPNGAIVHYRVNETTNRTVNDGDVVLIDSGGQYPDGTTDITRTMCAGTPSEECRRAFTRVLKGHIAVARQRFPEGTSGAELDPLARAALWQMGADFAHGTGHGVGAALSVHEGPVGISKRSRAPLKAGMILSNEPGYYVRGEYGIRIENLVLVEPAEKRPGEDKAMLSLETITLVPIDTRLVEPSLLTPEERAWLDSYHARVHGALVGSLSAREREWLEARCQAIA